MADEEQQKRDEALRVFLSGAGVYYPAFTNEGEQANAIEWFNDHFEWREAYNGNVEAAANDMVALWYAIASTTVDSEAKHTAEVQSARKQSGKRTTQPKPEPEPEPEPEPKKSRKSRKSCGGASSSGGESSSDAVPLAGPAPDAVSALVTFLSAFARMSAEEQRALLEKLQRQ
jgi:hypothetical protein